MTEPQIECHATGAMVPVSQAVYDRWGFAYASQRVLDEVLDATDDDADLIRLCAGWR